MAGPPPTQWARRHHCQMRHSGLSSESPCIQRSRAQKSAYLKVLYEICLYTHMDKGVAPAAWAIVLLVSPPPHGSPGSCKRHRCGREWQSLLYVQRPPSTHWSRRAHCQMRPSDFSDRVRLIPSISVLKPSMLLLNWWRPSIEFRRKTPDTVPPRN